MTLPPPVNRDQQPPYTEDAVRQLVKAKLENVIVKGYIELCDITDIEAMMYMFHVPKGETDVRMVYDGSKSGLNASLWAPWFSLPTIDTMARWVIAGSWLADNDYGEQFLNFPLHPELQKYCGVDLTQLFPELTKPESQLVVGRWTRNAMGLRPSPYSSVQGALIAKHLIMGDPKDKSNPFTWEIIRLNLPGTQDYDATLPWILKMRYDGKLAAGLVQYIDDLRIMAATKALAWAASSRMAKGLAYLGLQDAARKRRESSQKPGAWAGAVISTQDGIVTKSVTPERWAKTQKLVRRIAKVFSLSDIQSQEEEPHDLYSKLGSHSSKLGDQEVYLHYKALESITGFLTYVAMTYPMMVPYLKGLHLTLNSWRPNRDPRGWKKRKREVSTEDHGKHPVFVRAVARC